MAFTEPFFLPGGHPLLKRVGGELKFVADPANCCCGQGCDCEMVYGSAGDDYVYTLLDVAWDTGWCDYENDPSCMTGDPNGPGIWAYRTASWNLTPGDVFIMANPCPGSTYIVAHILDKIPIATWESDDCTWPPPTSPPWTCGNHYPLPIEPGGDFLRCGNIIGKDFDEFHKILRCAYSAMIPLVRPTMWCNPSTSTWEELTDTSSDFFWRNTELETHGGIPKDEWDAIVASAGTNHAIEIYLSADSTQCPDWPDPYGSTETQPLIVGTGSVAFAGNPTFFHIDSYSFVEPSC